MLSALRNIKKKKMSLKYLYLLSTASITLIACSAVGLILYFGSVNELKSANERQLTESLTLLANDLEMQQNALREVSFGISSEIYYKPFYFSRNTYYEIELLNMFSRLKNCSAIIGDYFLYYRGYGWLFNSNKTKSSLGSFMKANGFEDSGDRLYEMLNNTDDFAVFKNGGTVIFVLPVNTMGRDKENGRATVGFFIPVQKLGGRFKALAGDIEGDLYMIYEDQEYIPITHDGTDAAKYDEDSVLYLGTSAGGKFSVALKTQPSFVFKNLSVFGAVNAVYITLAVMILLSLSALIGYNNYSPIKRLSKKYIANVKGVVGKNELENVESFLDGALKEKRDAEISLQEQYALIKKQILKLLLSGDSRYASIVSKPFMGIYLPGPMFYVAAVKTPDILDDSEEDELARLTEDLSENGMYLFFTGTSFDEYYAVIISASDINTGQDAVDYVKTLLNGKITCEIGVSAPFESLSLIKDAFRIAQLNCGEMSKEKSGKHSGELLRFIDENFSDTEMSLDLLSGRFGLSNRYISSLIKEETGFTYKEYLTEYRIRKAQEILLNENVTVVEACERTGYTHLPHFIKTFKRITGFTPSSYSAERR